MEYTIGSLSELVVRWLHQIRKIHQFTFPKTVTHQKKLRFHKSAQNNMALVYNSIVS